MTTATDENLKSVVTPLTEAEFFRRLDQYVPGDRPPDEATSKIDTDLYFERLTLAGLEEMNRYSVDERLYQFLELRPFAGIEETNAYIERLLRLMGKEAQGRSVMCWFVRRRSDGCLVGTARLVTLNHARQSAEWGYGVDPELWGRGYILQMQQMLKHYVFEVLRLNRLGGVTMLENRRTISSLLATGMKHEGTLRQYYCKDGNYQDGWAYAMLAPEYFRGKTPASRNTPAYAVGDVIGIVSSVLGGAGIDASSTMQNTGNWDSLNHMAIMVAVADKTGIALSPPEIARATSVQAILSLLNDSR